MVHFFSKYSGKCSCGRTHDLVTRAAVIEPGCLRDFEKYMKEFGITGKRCALYGENGYRATADRHPFAQQEIILNPNGLHANEISTAEVLAKLEKDVEIIIAVGSGTIHDIARFCAHERGIRFISCVTGASVDGFCSTVAAMTWYGYKKTLPAVAPEIVIADTDIIKNAPIELVRSGVGDIAAKYTALCDWKIATAVTGEYFCQRIHDLMAEATDTVMKSVPGIVAGEDEAYSNITYALLLSGIAMQMIGNSRPASGCEHHISHLIEMEPEKLNVRFPAMHGEKTGVASVYGIKEYKRLAEIEDITPYLSEYVPFPKDDLCVFLGEKLAPAILEENEKDCLSAVSKENLAKAWPTIQKLIGELPEPDYLDGLLVQLGAKHRLEEIGVTEEDKDTLLKYSPMVRNRLTLMRMKRMISC
ncbi:MAG: sn-glycerol-1-phosphate dehydrogenase [Oscillospiraceae bacterium]|nr:sn-glycerol-1-phosphate dehydrogenase [Oscillospiraceae bacterium]